MEILQLQTSLRPAPGRTARTNVGGLRTILSLALALAFMLCSFVPAAAQTTTGTINGTITGQNGTPLSGVAVTAVSPSQRYAATTNANGFFSLTGVVPDTYQITLLHTGYQNATVDGVTVTPGQSVSVTQTLSQQLANIGRTSSRSGGSAFQPQQTQDTYTVTTDQINTILGKSNGTNEANLLASIPGASFDAGGYPVLRGGRENQEGYQFEGINYTDPFTNQFVNSLLLHGASQFQVTPGAGDASTGNAGTGAINVIAKRGTNPHFGQFEYDVYGGRSEQTGNAEYGWASPDGRLSSYTTFYKDRTGGYHYGANGAPAGYFGQGTIFNGRRDGSTEDFLENAVYRFGRNNNQSLQFFYNNTFFGAHLGYGFQDQPNGFGLGGIPLHFKNDDPFYLTFASQQTALSAAQIQALQPFTIGQTYLTQPLGYRGPFTYNQPNESYKLQYSWNVNPSTFLTAKVYTVNNVELFDVPYAVGVLDGSDNVSLQGGFTRGFALDMSKQLTPKHLLAAGFDFKFLHPVLTQPSGTGGLYSVTGAATGAGFGYEAADFLPNDAACPLGPNACGYLLGQLPGQPTAYISSGQRVPMANQSAQTQRQDYGIYVQDTFSPTDRIKINAGVRLDMANWLYGDCNISKCLPTSSGTLASGAPDPSKDRFDYDAQTRRPHVFQPRLSIVDQFTRNDSLRFAYQRSMQLPLIAYVDHTNNFASQLYGPYFRVPAYDALTGGVPTWCGTTHDRTCANYADQLLWDNESNYNGVPIQPLKPTTFTNLEVSYQHLFPHNYAMKLTPFYRKAYDEIAQAAQPVVRNGTVLLNPNGSPTLAQPTFTNLGNASITGVELYMTKQAAYGLSGSFSLTYQNEFSNVIPTSASENFFPSVPFESLQLGNRYRVGFLTPLSGVLALNYRTHSGWRINPVAFYNHGYPIGVGLLTPFTVNGVPGNIPNTNITNSAQLLGSQGAPQYVDPQNPGSLLAPNVAATRGTPETASAGGILSKAAISPVQITIEFTPPKNQRSTFGAVVQNVFNSLYNNLPGYSSLYQPVATGRNAPYSGYSSQLLRPEFFNYNNVAASHSGLPYSFRANGLPRTVEFYYQLNL
jgi:hypothetical protein